MSFFKWGYEFDGSYTNPNMLSPTPGVYVIWCQTKNAWKILDVGESGNVIASIIYHESTDRWKRNCSGTIRYSATYIPDKKERLELEKKIRISERVICGDHKSAIKHK